SARLRPPISALFPYTTLFRSIRSTIFSVVVTPTSEVTSTSSKLSSTSSSIVDLPTTALVILEKKPSLVFSNPLSKASCASGVSCFFLKKSNNPIVVIRIEQMKDNKVKNQLRLIATIDFLCTMVILSAISTFSTPNIPKKALLVEYQNGFSFIQKQLLKNRNTCLFSRCCYNFFHPVIVYHTFFESICTSLRRFGRDNDLSELFTATFL